MVDHLVSRLVQQLVLLMADSKVVTWEIPMVAHLVLQRAAQMDQRLADLLATYSGQTKAVLLAAQLVVQLVTRKVELLASNLVDWLDALMVVLMVCSLAEKLDLQ
jgi:hypothetical protein